MKKGDDAAMMANLKAQGITTVVSISSNGAVDSPTTPPVAPGAGAAIGKGEGSPRGQPSRRAPGGAATLVLG
jgi:hypothetical protein